MAQLIMGFFPVIVCIGVAVRETTQTVAQEAQISSHSGLIPWARDAEAKPVWSYSGKRTKVQMRNRGLVTGGHK